MRRSTRIAIAAAVVLSAGAASCGDDTTEDQPNDDRPRLVELGDNVLAYQGTDHGKVVPCIVWGRREKKGVCAPDPGTRVDSHGQPYAGSSYLVLAEDPARLAILRLSDGKSHRVELQELPDASPFDVVDRYGVFSTKDYTQAREATMYDEAGDVVVRLPPSVFPPVVGDTKPPKRVAL